MCFLKKCDPLSLNDKFFCADVNPSSDCGLSPSLSPHRMSPSRYHVMDTASLSDGNLDMTSNIHTENLEQGSEKEEVVGII